MRISIDTMAPAHLTNVLTQQGQCASEAGTYSLKLALHESRGQASGSTTLEVPAVSLAGQGDVTLTIDGAGGAVSVTQATLARVYGVNLLPNPSFEQTAAGVPVGWSPGSITNGGQCTIAAADGGHRGDHYVRVTCTRAGGDFGANLQWQGIPAADVDRKFELGCWVETPPRASHIYRIKAISDGRSPPEDGRGAHHIGFSWDMRRITHVYFGVGWTSRFRHPSTPTARTF